MKRIFLEDYYAGYQVMAWARRNNATIVRCIPKFQGNIKGCVVYYL